MRATYAAVMRNNLEWTNIVKKVSSKHLAIRWALQWKLANVAGRLESFNISSMQGTSRIRDLINSV